MKRCKTCGKLLIEASRAATKCYDCRRAGVSFRPSIMLVDQRIVADVAYVIEQMGDGK